ncbi:ParB/RepB/Spo0J family partition protein [Methylobacterium sp. 22177]|uniref:ParB/RepB/Spo0J family partition protein n=1 Tax=Methylobacterium sp. 22177 TaxID=3453885 RepID=UPI003F8321FC
MIKNLPLNVLLHGHDASAPEGVVNVRLAGREDGIYQLAASIHALGLLQPLTVVPGAGQAHYVVDGNRRLAALRTLAGDGRIRTDTPVAVIECDAGAARELGLAANSTQARMHEADQYRAFHALLQEGMGEADIASRFGIEPVRIRRMLALGQLADEVLDAWRAGNFGRDPVDTVRSFTLASSLDEQRAVLEKLRGAGRLYAHCVRSELGVGDHDLSRNLAFVGRDAYVAAGGGIIEDLFGDNDRVEHPALLKRLVDELVAAEVKWLVADGWSWAALDASLPDNARWSWQTLRAEPRAATAAETARLEELRAIVDADEDADGVAAAEQEAEDIELDRQQDGYTTEQRGRSGVILRIGRAGKVDMTLGVVRPATAAVAKVFAKIEGGDAAKALADAKAEQPEPQKISAALTLRLSQQRTIAMRDAMLASPQIALAALLATAIAQDSYSSPVRITLNGYNEAPGGPAVDAEKFEAAFERLADMPMDALLTVAAGVAGRALDLQIHAVGAVPSSAKGAKALEARLDAARMGEATRERWDAADFFKSAPKAVALRAVAESLGQPEADRIAGLTKPEIAAVALARVVPTGWLPSEIRPVGYAVAPAAEATPAPKTARKKAA